MTSPIVVSPYTEAPHLLDLETLASPEYGLLTRALTIFEAQRKDYATAPYPEVFNFDQVFAYLRTLAQRDGYLVEDVDQHTVNGKDGETTHKNTDIPTNDATNRKTFNTIETFIVAFYSKIRPYNPPTSTTTSPPADDIYAIEPKVTSTSIPKTVLANPLTARLAYLDKAAHAEAIASGGFLKYWFGQATDDPVHGRNLATCVWQSLDDAKRGSSGALHREAAQAARSSYEEWKIRRYRYVIEDGLRSWSLEEV